MNKEPDDWITINGQHVPIFEGEGKREAVSRFINKKMSRVKKNKTKYDTINEFRKRKQSNLKNNDDIKSKYKTSDDGNRYELNDEEKAKVMRKLNRDKSELKKFDVSNDNTKYTMKKEELEKVAKDLGLDIDVFNEANEREQIEKQDSSSNRLQKLTSFMENNRDLINEWQKDFDDEVVSEKVLSGKGLTLKEYFGVLGRKPREGDIILGGGRNGEDVRVGKNGKLEIINNFKKRKSSNK